MIKYGELRRVHIELTSKCNLSCPQCARNISGGILNDKVPVADISLHEMKQYFPEELLKRMVNVFMCGCFGDPAASKDVLEICRWIRQVNPDIFITMSTNGSLRNEDWWGELARIIGKKGFITFCIDGVGDEINQLYRIGSSYDKIMSNASSYIKNGGVARQSFLVFKHNQHQVDLAKKISKIIGFNKFIIKKTARFHHSKRSEVDSDFEVVDKNGNVTHYLEPPTDDRYKNNSYDKIKLLKKAFGSLERYCDLTEIDCEYERNNQVYVSSEGLVLPCCWMGNNIYHPYAPFWSDIICNVIDEYGGKEAISLSCNSMEKILESGVFAAIKESFGRTVKTGKPRICALNCGESFSRCNDQIE